MRIQKYKADLVNTVVFNLHQIKRQAFFGTPGRLIDNYTKDRGTGVTRLDILFSLICGSLDFHEMPIT